MTNFERFVLAALPLVPKVLEAIQKWGAGEAPETPLDEEVRRILGPAEDRLDRAIREARDGSQDPG